MLMSDGVALPGCNRDGVKVARLMDMEDFSDGRLLGLKWVNWDMGLEFQMAHYLWKP